MSGTFLVASTWVLVSDVTSARRKPLSHLKRTFLSQIQEAVSRQESTLGRGAPQEGRKRNRGKRKDKPDMEGTYGAGAVTDEVLTDCSLTPTGPAT